MGRARVPGLFKAAGNSDPLWLHLNRPWYPKILSCLGYRVDETIVSSGPRKAFPGLEQLQ